MPRSTILNPHRPFSPAQFPFYYGWVILICATLGMVTAVPGSPPGMSPFLDPMLAVYGIQRSHFTFAYMAGTILAGIATWKVSALFDLWDTRLLGTLALFLLGLSLIFTGLAHHLFALIPTDSALAPLAAVILLTTSFFLIRFLGLGVMMTLTRSMIVRWFVQKRSLAVSLNGMVLSLSFASAPVLVFLLVDAVGWQQAWILMGLFFALAMALLAFLFFRHSPEQSGLVAPGGSLTRRPGQEFSPRGERRFPVYRDFSPQEAVKTTTFWIIVATLACNGIAGTGIVLNLVAFGADQGLPEQQALALLFPSALFNILTTLWLGAVGHRTEMRWVLLLMVGALLMKLIGAVNLASFPGQAAFAIGGGIAWGCFGILVSLPWPRYFGTAFIGSINSYVTSFTIVASAVGPFIFGIIKDFTGTFDLAIRGCLLVLPFLFISCLFLKNPQRKFTPPSSGQCPQESTKPPIS